MNSIRGWPGPRWAVPSYCWEKSLSRSCSALYISTTSIQSKAFCVPSVSPRSCWVSGRKEDTRFLPNSTFPVCLRGGGRGPVTVVKMSLCFPLARAFFVDWQVRVTVDHGSNLDVGCRGGNVEKPESKTNLLWLSLTLPQRALWSMNNWGH